MADANDPHFKNEGFTHCLASNLQQTHNQSRSASAVRCSTEVTFSKIQMSSIHRSFACLHRKLHKSHKSHPLFNSWVLQRLVANTPRWQSSWAKDTAMLNWQTSDPPRDSATITVILPSVMYWLQFEHSDALLTINKSWCSFHLIEAIICVCRYEKKNDK